MTTDLHRVFDGPNYRVKDQQKAALYATIRNSGGITRKELAHQHSIRRTTVSNLVQELAEDNLIHEGELEPTGNQGRPQIPLFPNFDRFAAIALYFVSLELKGTLVNSGDQVLDEHTTSLSESTDHTELGNSILETVRYLRSRIPHQTELLGCSITFPGYVDTSNRTWVYSARLPHLAGFSLQELSLRIQYPLECMRSLDAELEYLLDRNPGYRNGGTMLVHWGYGIGAAYAYEGNVIRTGVGSFAEFGHIPFVASNRSAQHARCICGNIGCLETEAALWAILPQLQATHPDLPQDEAEFANLFAGSSLESHPAVEHAIASFGQALASLVTLFAPDHLLIYGPFISSNRVFKTLHDKLAEDLSPILRNVMKVKPITSGFAGDVFGSTSRLFRNGIARNLLAK